MFLKPYSSKAVENIYFAGLLTYSCLYHLPILQQWYFDTNIPRAYSSGSVQDLHLIPFSSLMEQSSAKIHNIIENLLFCEYLFMRFALVLISNKERPI